MIYFAIFMTMYLKKWKNFSLQETLKKRVEQNALAIAKKV